MDTISGAILLVIQYLLSIIGILSLLYIVIGGIKYVLSAVNEEKMKSANDIIYFVMLRLAIALMAYGMLDVLNTILQG